MNIKAWFGYRKTRALDQVDRLIVGGLTSTEQQEARREIADQFESLLDQMQEFADERDKLLYDVQRDNELIRMLCGKEA